MSKFRGLLALVLLGSIALVPATSRADAVHLSICDAVAGNLVKNCGFETGFFLPAWTVTRAASGSDISVTGIPFLVHSGTHAAFFGAMGTTDDSISQILSTTAGRTFRLSFFLENESGAPPGAADFSASWDGKRVFHTTTTFFPYTQSSFVVRGTGSDTLQFAGHAAPGPFPPSGPFGHWGLDDVVVTQIPEPSTLSLFGLGLLLGCAFLARKKKLVNGVQA